MKIGKFIRFGTEFVNPRHVVSVVPRCWSRGSVLYLADRNIAESKDDPETVAHILHAADHDDREELAAFMSVALRSNDKK